MGAYAGKRAGAIGQVPKQIDPARACALREAPKYGLLPTTLDALITDATRYDDGYRRALHVIERREVVVQLAPITRYGGERSRRLPDPSSVDPWSVDPERLARESRVEVDCPSCMGTREMTCPDCAGGGRITCRGCGGACRVPGKRGMKNCPECRANGTRRCACSNGRVGCTPCHFRGGVDAWLTIQRSVRSDVVVHPRQSVALQAHAEVWSPIDFDRNAWPHPLSADTGVQLPSVSMPHELRPVLHASWERSISARVQTFSAVTNRFVYRTFEEGQIDVAGTPPRVLASSNFGPLRRRRSTGLGVWLALCVAAVVLAVKYASRDPWFARYGDPGLVLLAGLVLAVFGALVSTALFLPRRLWSLTRLGVPVILLAISVGGVGSAWARSQPSTKGLKAAIKREDTARIESEAKALRALRIDEDAGADALDMLRLTELKSAPHVYAMAAIARESWYVEGGRERAVVALRPSARRELAALVAANDVDGLVRLSEVVGPLDVAFQKDVDAHVSYVRGLTCASRRDCECVKRELRDTAKRGLEKVKRAKLLEQASASFASGYRGEIATSTRTNDPYARQEALRGAIAHGRCYEQIAYRQSDPPLPTVEATLRKVDIAVDVADKRAALERRQREVAAENEERVRKARENAGSARGSGLSAGGGGRLMCNDGTLSPRCTCGGSRRGCCSHHGGVQGCQ